MRRFAPPAVVAVLLGSALGLVAAQDRAAGPAPPALWEYKAFSSGGNNREVERLLNDAGAAGWELTSVTADANAGLRSQLKRPKR